MHDVLAGMGIGLIFAVICIFMDAPNWFGTPMTFIVTVLSTFTLRAMR